MRNQPEFEQIYKEYQPKIRHYLSRMLGYPVAEDVAQEVFAKISCRQNSFKGKSSLSTWIYRIATNAALEKLRSPSFKPSPEHITLEDFTEKKIGMPGLHRPIPPSTRRLYARK